MVGLQCGGRISASQTLVAVTLAEFLELLDSKVSTAGVSRSSPLTTIVGLRSHNFFRIILGPLLTTSNYFFAIAFVVIEAGSRNALPVIRCPALFVLGYLFPVFFLVCLTCLNSMRQARSGSLILSILL